MTLTNPLDWIHTVITLVADHTTHSSKYSRPAGPGVDVGNTFFTEVLKFSEEKKAQVDQDALEFFKKIHGLDFSQCEPDEQGKRHYQNAVLMLIRPEFETHAFVNRCGLTGIIKSECYPIDIGGYSVRFKDQQRLYGTYGGEEGKLVKAGDVLGYQFYNIPVFPNEPLVLQFQTTIPVRLEPVDGHTIANMEVSHPKLGKGCVHGVFGLASLPEDVSRIIMRGVITFPEKSPSQ